MYAVASAADRASSPREAAPSNADVADVLERVGDMLELQDANPFRVRSYRSAAAEIRALRLPVANYHRLGGRDSLREIPGVGRALASAIAEILETGRLALLDRMENDLTPEFAFRRLPGVGPELARRIHEELDVHTLEELERAAHDGRLEGVEGIGPRRARGIRDALAGLLGRSSARRARERVARHQPAVPLLLEVDAEYRRKAAAGKLRTIAPRRFNPERVSWLPIMEVTRDGWDFTALFSNTQRAHALGRTDDWVVLYWDRDGEHGQCTVVTARGGPMAGLRVVRGREPECRGWYDHAPHRSAGESRLP